MSDLKLSIKNIFNRKNKIPIIAPNYILVFYPELFKVCLISIDFKLTSGIFLNSGFEINDLHPIVAK